MHSVDVMVRAYRMAQPACEASHVALADLRPSTHCHLLPTIESNR